MNRALLVANPAASQFTGGLHRSVARTLKKHYELEAVWPQGPDDARQITAKAVSDGVSLVVAMGGDGIVHHVAQALAGTQVALGIVPTGTTNVVARIHGVPKKAHAAARILAGEYETRMVPAIEISAETADGIIERHALFSMGVGIDAEVVAMAELEPYRKWRFGWVHYTRTAFRVLWQDVRKRKREFRVSFADSNFEGIGLLVQIHPVFTFFSRIPLTIDHTAPHPMSALVIQRLPFRRSLRFLALARKGHLDELPDMQLIRNCEGFEVESLKRPQQLQLDGELVTGVIRLTARFNPQALRLAVPAPEQIKRRRWFPRRT